MKLGLDSYSFHRFFGETTRWETPSEIKWSLTDFLDFVSRTNLDVASLETCYLGDPKKFDLDAIKSWRKATGKEVVFTWGHPAGLNGGINTVAFQDAFEFLRVAHELNMPQMRIVLGNHFNFEEDINERKNRLKPMIVELLAEAEKFNILISIENHADFRTKVLYDFICEINHPLLGMCFDFSNCLRVGDSPIEFLRNSDLNKIFMVHVKDVKKLPEDVSPIGWWPTVEWGTGDVGTKECLHYLQGNKFNSLLLVEISNLYHGLDEISVVNHAISFLENNLVGKINEH
jgi:sugar phosphate isomerase/epimerase